jgi:hypothetical protein
MHGLTGGGWKRKRSATVTGVAQPTGNHRKKGPGTYRRPAPPRQPPTLHGRFYRSQLYPLLKRINTYLMRWAGKKYRRLRPCKRFKAWWSGLLNREPRLFAHWTWVDTFAGMR